MKSNYLILLLMITFVVGNVNAQKSIKIDLAQKFTTHAVHQIDVNSMLPSLKDDHFSMNLSIGDNSWDIALEDSGILADHYSMTAIGDNGSEIVTQNRAKAYNGYVLGSSDSRVSLTFNKDFIYGFIRVGNETMNIEPLRFYDLDARDNEFITYLDTDIIPNSEHKCGVEKKHEKYRDLNKVTSQSRSVGECFEVEWAIVSDYLMYLEEGSSVFLVEDHNIGVVNDVQTNYDDEFADEIQFLIVEQQVFTTAASDPFTTSTSAGALLSDFTDWAPSGFNQIHDVGSIWTGRNFDGGTIGVAWVGAICTSFRYNALENFTTNSSTKRVMVAHELGHNFDASHDAGGSPYIMAPSVSTSTTWSSASIADMENYYNSISCLSNCPASGSAPIPDFITTVTQECVTGNVVFTDISVDNPTDWLWTFEGGTPSTSTSQNPTVTYQNSGEFDVTLEVSNAFGSDVITKTNEVQILDEPVAEWFVSTNLLLAVFSNTSIGGDSYFWDLGDGNFDINESPIHNYETDGVYTVTLTVTNSCGTDVYTNDVEIVTLPTADFSATPTTGCSPMSVTYEDLSSTNTTEWLWQFEGGVPATSTAQNPTVTYNTVGVYDVSLTSTNASGTDEVTKSEYITVNNAATSSFTYEIDGGEVTFTNTSTNADSYSWSSGNGDTSTDENPTFTYPASGAYEVVLTATSACGDVSSAQIININLAPVAVFSTEDNTTGCPTFTIQFADESTFNPESWTWTFEGGTPATSTEQNPTVEYATPGVYDVSLTVTNGQGMDVAMSEDYIVVQDQVTSAYNYTADGLSMIFENESAAVGLTYLWDFGDGMTSTEAHPEYVYAEEGIYDVTLTVTGPCNSDVMTQTVNLYTSPTAGFTSDVVAGCSELTVSYSQTASDNVTSYNWTFEGGSPATSDEPNPTVVYSTAGTYNVELMVSNPVANSNATETDYITVTDTPTADFEAINNMQNVSFNNNSLDGDSYVWDFGDGNTSTEESPVHNYDNEGVYMVTLTATNGCGEDVISYSVAANSLPSASGLASATTGCGVTEIQFSDNSSDNVTEWFWTFEGGTPATSTEQNPLISYTTPGTYDVSLMATAEAGSDEVVYEDLITINGIATSEFEFTNTDLDFEFNYTGEYGDTFEWDFGDGNTSTDMNPSHTYEEYDTYTVTLVVSNTCAEAEYSQDVDIINAVSDVIAIKNLNIFPNPTSDLFYIELELTESIDLELQVMDIHGRLVKQEIVANQNLKINHTIDLSNEASGTYLLRFINGKQVKNTKIILAK